MADYISARQARLGDYSNRPRPIKAAASRLSAILGAVGAVAAALASWGGITAAQHDAVTGLLGVLAVAGPGLIAALVTVLASFGIVRRAEPLVTPTSDPRSAAGAPLVVRSPPGDLGSGLADPRQGV